MIALFPLLELIFYGFDDLVEACEVAVVKTQASHELPDAFDRIEVRAVRRQEIKRKTIRSNITPVSMQLGVVIPGIVRDDNHPAPGSRAGPAELLEEVPARLRVEALAFPSKDEAAIAQADGAEITHALASGIVPDHRIRDVGRNPHAAAGAVLLEVDFINCPQIDVASTRQIAEFFYAPIGAPRPLWRSPGGVCAGENPIAGTAVGTGVPRFPFPSVAQ